MSKRSLNHSIHSFMDWIGIHCKQLACWTHHHFKSPVFATISVNTFANALNCFWLLSCTCYPYRPNRGQPTNLNVSRFPPKDNLWQDHDDHVPGTGSSPGAGRQGLSRAATHPGRAESHTGMVQMLPHLPANPRQPYTRTYIDMHIWMLF